MREIGVGKVASVMGRYVCNRFAITVGIVWNWHTQALTKGEGETAVSGRLAIQASYDAEKYDEFVMPTVVTEDGKANPESSKTMIPLFLQFPSCAR